MKRAPADKVGRFEFLAGFSGFKWKGQRTTGSPSSNDPNRPRLLVNSRGIGDGFTNRAGLSEVNSSAFQSSSACVKGTFDFPLATPQKLWIQGDGCPGISSSTGYYLAHIDPEQDPEFQRAIYYDAAVSQPVIGSFDGDLYVGIGADLKKVQLIANPWGTENLATSGASQDTPIETFTGFTIRCLQEFDGQLYIGLDNGAGASKIATYDGLSVRDDLTGIDVPRCFGLYHMNNGGDALVVGFPLATGHLRRRTTGTSPGTWETLTGTVGTAGIGAMADYGDVLYIAGGNGAIYQLSGSTISTANSPASATAVRTLKAANTYLYYGYETAAAALIGRYDGSSWVDAHKNLTTQFTGTSSVRALEFYREHLFAGGVRSGTGRLFLVDAGDTSGSWTEVTPNALNNGDVDALLVV